MVRIWPEEIVLFTDDMPDAGPPEDAEAEQRMQDMGAP